MNTTGGGRGWCHQICKPQRPRQPRTCWMLAEAFLVWSWLWQQLRFRQRFILFDCLFFRSNAPSVESSPKPKQPWAFEFPCVLSPSIAHKVDGSSAVGHIVPIYTVLHYYSVQPASLPQCSSSGPHFATRLKFRGRAIKMLTSVLPFHKCIDCIKQHFIFIEKLIF